MEILQQQRQYVLSPDSREALARAVPVFVKLLIPVERAIRAVTRRELPPEFVNDFERFGPELMSVPADHVGDDEAPARSERASDAAKQPFQVDYVVQGL